ncbi:hypothetical protein JD844_008652 [Phrynosoma platyrhinos]|uniref:WD repeat domain 41 n=1 Tax=Phrynosoma platyrhinos TaxID=52577 RepID=A0ABQ7TEY3_PHRPL|nr:hypothetical protein JD844_008652 [Phrynosoma platyrhinos]
MLRWLIGGSGRESQGLAEKSVQPIGEEQSQNPYTELLVLKGHHDIVRFLVAIDDYSQVSRFSSLDNIIFLRILQKDFLVFSVAQLKPTGEKLFELHAHTQKITALAAFPLSDTCEEKCHMILTAAADRTVVVWDCDSGKQIHKVSCFHSTVKCLTVLQRLDVWLSGGSDLCVWNRKLDLLCKTSHLIDADITAMIELPKNCVAAAVGKELIIFRLKTSRDGTEWDVFEVKRLLDHQDSIVSLVSVSELIFATGSHVGELIVWDSLDWTVQAYECNWDASLHVDPQQEIKLSHSQSEVSVQHLASDEEHTGHGNHIYCNTGSGFTRQLISCSEDGSVRIWELREKQQLTAEPVPSGFFSIWGFGRTNKQVNHIAKKTPESTTVFSLDLIGDLIGHSSAVQMFLFFTEHGLATCSADNFIILWKDGERESRLRSLMLFHKLEQNEDLQLRI